jgi:Leucine-rich repeat (LRR) protein
MCRVILLFGLILVGKSVSGLVCKNDPGRKNIQSDTVYNIENCANTEIDLGAETARASLNSVKAFSNQISKISDDTFKSAKQLTHIDLRENRIEQISVGAFKDQANLQFLILKQNKLTRIEVGTFDSLVELKELWLQYNQLTLIEKGLFDQNTNLEVLYLNENKIAGIESTVFAKLNKIKSLFLKDNICTNLNYNSNKFERDFNCFKRYESYFRPHVDQIYECRSERTACLKEKGLLKEKLNDLSDAEGNLSKQLQCCESIKKRSNSISAEATNISYNFLIMAGIILLDLILFLTAILQICQLFKENKILNAKLDKLCADNIYERVDSMLTSPQTPSTD